MGRRSAIVSPASKLRTAGVVWGCACACARVRASVHECGVRTPVFACVRDVFAIYDDNILSRLILILIKMIILYVIQIRHTDDFPSAGIPASTTNVWCNLDSRTG